MGDSARSTNCHGSRHLGPDTRYLACTREEGPVLEGTVLTRHQRFLGDFQYQIEGLRIRHEIPGTKLDASPPPPLPTQEGSGTAKKSQESDRMGRGVTREGEMGHAPAPVALWAPVVRGSEV